MSSAGHLEMAVASLRDAGYVDASRSNPLMGDPLHVLSVSTDDETTKAAVKRIVAEIDAHARPII